MFGSTFKDADGNYVGHAETLVSALAFGKTSKIPRQGDCRGQMGYRIAVSADRRRIVSRLIRRAVEPRVMSSSPKVDSQCPTTWNRHRRPRAARTGHRPSPGRPATPGARPVYAGSVSRLATNPVSTQLVPSPSTWPSRGGSRRRAGTRSRSSRSACVELHDAVVRLPLLADEQATGPSEDLTRAIHRAVVRVDQHVVDHTVVRGHPAEQAAAGQVEPDVTDAGGQHRLPAGGRGR